MTDDEEEEDSEDSMLIRKHYNNWTNIGVPRKKTVRDSRRRGIVHIRCFYVHSELVF